MSCNSFLTRCRPSVNHCVSHQSDTTETPVSCVVWDAVSAAECIFVFQAGFSGKQVLEFWPILFGAVDCCASSDKESRRRNHNKRRLTNVPVRAGITRPMLQ